MQFSDQLPVPHEKTGVSNRWTGIWNGTVKWKIEWNSECIQLELTRVTGVLVWCCC